MLTLRRTLAVLTTLLAAVALAQAPKPVAAPTSAPEASRAEYNAIFSHLDAGGDLLIVANTDGMIEDFVAIIRGFAAMAPTMGPAGRNPAVEALDRVPAFLKTSGLSAVDGVGLSVVPRADGLNDVKGFVYRDPAAASLPFWQGTIGGAPKRLATLDYLPPDTALVRAGTGDPRQFWKLIQDGVRQIGGAEVGQDFDGFLAEVGTKLGTNVNSVIASLDAEQFLSIQLSSSQTVQVPIPGSAPGQEPLTIPVPSLLAGCAVRDDSLAATLVRVLQQQQVPIVQSTSGATTLYTFNVPAPLPFPVAPTFAVHRGMFLFGTTAEVVKNAIARVDTPAASRAALPLDKAFAGLPQQNNGIAYVDRRFAETLTKVQSHFLRMTAGSGDPALKGAQLDILQKQQAGPAALVFLNEKDGISVRGISAQGGRQILLGMTVMPVAMWSAVAVPSMMMRSQVRASTGPRPLPPQNNTCINNLRLIDHAKQQWAVAGNKADTDTPTMADLVRYFKNGRLPACPQGGTYTIRSVGEAPTCSKPGHVLPE
jgi:hypothetical protein